MTLVPPKFGEWIKMLLKNVLKIVLGCVLATNSYPNESMQKPVLGIDSISVERCVAMYSKPANTLEVGRLCPEDDIQTFLVVEQIEAGIGFVKSIPEGGGEEFFLGERVLVLDYVGEGRSRILYNGVQYISKVPRKVDCMNNYNEKYCWLELVKEPGESTWVYIESEADVGWVSSGLEFYSNSAH